MDSLDRAIINQLQRDGSLTNTELAERVGLTQSPCLRRVRRLEADGVISGYYARINPTATDQGFEVIVNANLGAQDRETVVSFESYVAGRDEVIEFRRMFGKPDYLIRVAVRDLEAYESFLTTKLMAAPGVATVDSHICMKMLKGNS